MNKWCQRIILLLLLVPFLCGTAPAQTIQQNLPVADGPINSLSLSGSTLYLGGQFGYVGPFTGSVAQIDAVTGIPNAAFAKTDGPVYALVQDGAGGYYIGGAFSNVDGTARTNIAHILNTGALDPGWNPGSNGTVYALELGGGLLYAGGSFSFIGGAARNNIAAINTATALSTAWDPNGNGTVRALKLSGTTIYAGGDFLNIGAAGRQYIAEIDLALGTSTAWNPNANGIVRAIDIGGGLVYAGGDFLSIGGGGGPYIAAIDALGSATAWNPASDGVVRAIRVSGASIYAGGDFSFIGGAGRNRIVELDGTATATAWNPNANANVHALFVTAADVIAGGEFTNIGGSARRRLAAIDRTTGLATGWNPGADDIVRALDASGSSIYAAGLFSSAGGYVRNNIAAVDINTGAVLPFDPNANAPVVSVYALGTSVYAGGFFTIIGGASRDRIVELTAAGTATAWNPGANNRIWAFESSANYLYAAGDFTQIASTMRNRIVRFDRTTGALDLAWNPNADGRIHALALDGSTLYVGGEFLNIGGSPRNRIAALDVATGNATAWDPNADQRIRAILLTPTTVYIGGSFLNVGPTGRQRIAEVSKSTGLVTAWNPIAGVDVLALAMMGRVYAGGYFNYIGPATRNHIAAIDPATGLATAWDPNFTIGTDTRSIVLNSSALFAGGNFNTVMGQPRHKLVGLTPDCTMPVVTADPVSVPNACIGSTATFTSAASGNPAPTPQWEESTDGGGTWNPLGGATNASYSVTVDPTLNNRQYRALWTNTCGNATSAAATLTIDAIPPTIVCPANITQGSDPAQCGAVVTFAATTSDNCPGETYACVPPSGSFFPTGTTPVTCTATDVAQNSASCTFSVTVNDTEPPSVFCPANITQGNDPNQCSAVVTFTATATDNCPGVGVACVPPSGSTFPVGTTPVTCTATDGVGNTASCSFSVTVNDTQPPVVICPANITQGNDPNQCSAVVTFTATATDNCPGVGVACVPPSGSTFPVGTTTVNCTATDAAGNTASCSFSVTVNDMQPPVVICPANITKNNDPNLCSAVATFTATATDNCPGVLLACVPPSGTAFPVGVTTVTCTATDGAGNTASCTFTVTVNDVQPPAITCPANITRGNDPNLCGAVVTWNPPLVSDNCPGVGTPVCVPPSGSFFPKGTTPVACSVADAHGNSANCSFTVTVNDVQPPTIICPANITRSNDPGLCGATVTFTPTVSDNCPGVSYVCNPPSGTFFPVATTTVTCIATDASANTASCSFTVRVNDTEPPRITCPRNEVVESDATCLGANVTYPPPVVTDNCPGVTYVCSPPSGAYFPIGITTVTCTATDAHNNTASCTFTVEVIMRVKIAVTSDVMLFRFGCKLTTPYTKTITITNVGGHFGGGVLVWNATTSASEISLSPGSGIEGDNLNITINPGALTPGTYTRTITLTAWNSVTNAPACNSPFTITVTIEVEPPIAGSQTKSVGTGGFTPFTNSVGQVMAEIKSNTTTVSSFTVYWYPCTYPPGMARLRYIKRYFKFATNATNYNFDIRLYYSNSEMYGVSRPDLLTLRRQPVSGGAWVDMGGTSDVFNNNVTATGVTALQTNWAIAHVWIPKRLDFSLITATFDRATRNGVIQWRSPLLTSADGFSVERSMRPDGEDWDQVGSVPYNPSGEYGFSEKLMQDGRYYYRLAAMDAEGNWYESEPFTIDATSQPVSYLLEQNYPNPFNPSTTIRYQIAEQGRVLLKVYDIYWREVTTLMDKEQPAGRYEVTFDASSLPSGVYYYKLESGSFTQIRKMNLMK